MYRYTLNQLLGISDQPTISEVQKGNIATFMKIYKNKKLIDWFMVCVDNLSLNVMSHVKARFL